MIKKLILSAALTLVVIGAPVVASANYVNERYHDRAPAGENDRILGETFVKSLTSVLK